MLKSYIALLLSNVIKLASVALIVFLLAHQWTPMVFGQFLYALTVVSLIQIALDFGFSLHTVRALSQPDCNRSEVFGQHLQLKHLISVVTIICAIPVLLALLGREGFILGCLLMLSSVFFSYANFLLLPLQANHAFNEYSKWLGISNGIFIVLGGACMLLHPGPLEVALAFLLARALGFGLIYVKMQQQLNIRFWQLQLSRALFAHLGGSSFYALQVFLGTLYVQADTFFLKYYHGYAEVGLYQAGVRLVLIACMVADVFNSMYLPYCSRLKHQPRVLAELQQRAARLMILLGGLMFCAFALLAKPITMVLFGSQYKALIGLLPLFGYSVFLRCAGAPFGMLMTILDSQRLRCVILLSTLLVNCLLNYYFTQHWGAVGAICAAILTLCYLNAIYIGFSVRALKSWRIDSLSLLALLCISLGAYCVWWFNAVWVQWMLGAISVLLLLGLAMMAKNYREVKPR